MFKCECGKEFENGQAYNGHKANCKQHLIIKYGSEEAFIKIQEKNRYYAKQASLAAATKNNAKKQAKLEHWISEQHTCEKCGKVMTEKYGSGRFCCRACANARDRSKDAKEKISQGVKNSKTYQASVQNKAISSEAQRINYLANPKLCKCCGQPIPYERRFKKCCSSECAHKLVKLGAMAGGKAAAQKRVIRSKNEVYFCELCKNYFKKVRHNEPIFNGWDADIIIDDIKYAVLWNGPWHYRKVTKKHSVKQVQNRDAIKVTEIKKCGYIPYIIKDNGKYNRTFVEEQFNIFIESIV